MILFNHYVLFYLKWIHINFSVTDSYVKISIILLILKNVYKNSYYDRDNYEKMML